jgi:hypothetical protein
MLLGPEPVEAGKSPIRRLKPADLPEPEEATEPRVDLWVFSLLESGGHHDTPASFGLIKEPSSQDGPSTAELDRIF